MQAELAEARSAASATAAAAEPDEAVIAAEVERRLAAMPKPEPEPREDGETDDRQAAIDAATSALRAELETKAEATKQRYLQQMRDQVAKIKAASATELAAVKSKAASDLAAAQSAAADAPAATPALDEAAIAQIKADAIEQFKRDQVKQRSQETAARLAKAKAASASAPPATSDKPVASTSAPPAPPAAKANAKPKRLPQVPPAAKPTPTATGGGMSIKGVAAGDAAAKPPKSVFAGAITQAVTGEKRARTDDEPATLGADDAGRDAAAFEQACEGSGRQSRRQGRGRRGQCAGCRVMSGRVLPILQNALSQSSLVLRQRSTSVLVQAA